MKQNKIPVLFIIVFGLAGLGMLLGGFSWRAGATHAKETCIAISAEIVDVVPHGDHHSVCVNYSYNGTDYERVVLDYYSISMREGKEITLFCDPDNPMYIKGTSEDSFASGALICVGFIFFLVSLLCFAYNIKYDTHKQNLLACGQKLRATVDSIDYDTRYSANSKQPFIIYCSYYDQYKDVTYHFESEHLWTDPSPIFPPGSHIKVFVDASDYSKYYVDVDSPLNSRIIDYT